MANASARNQIPIRRTTLDPSCGEEEEDDGGGEGGWAWRNAHRLRPEEACAVWPLPGVARAAPIYDLVNNSPCGPRPERSRHDGRLLAECLSRMSNLTA